MYGVRNTYGSNQWYEGNGDNATFSSYNSAFSVWYGMAWKSYDGTVNYVLNARSGDWYTNGTWTGNAQSSTSDDRVKDF